MRLPRRPERRLGLVEAVGHAAVRVMRRGARKVCLPVTQWRSMGEGLREK
jgi:hypothetical protein